jgi:hypothetical protein
MEKIPKEKLEEAKKLYMEYSPITVIANQTGLKRTSLQHHVKTWKQEREICRAELMQQLAEAKRADFASIMLNSTKIIKRAIEDLANREEPPTAREAKNMAEVVEKFDKILRLDSGSPTEIKEERPMDVSELREKLRLDPFYKEDAIEVDFTQVVKVPTLSSGNT